MCQAGDVRIRSLATHPLRFPVGCSFTSSVCCLSATLPDRVVLQGNLILEGVCILRRLFCAKRFGQSLSVYMRRTRKALEEIDSEAQMQNEFQFRACSLLACFELSFWPEDKILKRDRERLEKKMEEAGSKCQSMISSNIQLSGGHLARYWSCKGL